MEQVDILVAGGGIAGMGAAARHAALGRRVALVDPAPPGQSDDQRTTALLQPAIDTLTTAGAWAGMAPAGAALQTMRLVDAGGRERTPRETADFNAHELRDGPFGVNVPNQAIRGALETRLAEQGVARHEASVSGTTLRGVHRIARLSDGTQIAARLVIAADGRESGLRREARIPTRRWSYGQRGLVFAVHHPEPHGGVSTEIHRTGGPLTLVPMPDQEGRPTSSVVWMVPSARAERLSALEDAPLAAELTAETMGLFGPLEICSPRAVWPIIGQMALRLAAPRLALVAEAAHVIPPIGAQGLNMSFRDTETLARLIAEAEDPGAPWLLRRYERMRLPDMAARVGGVDILNRFAQAEAQPIRDLRRLGLTAINRITPVRRLAMRLGLGI
ncbi:MAG: FAD-dependent monooxygenase [Pseudomonadota bacterium]